MNWQALILILAIIALIAFGKGLITKKGGFNE